MFCVSKHYKENTGSTNMICVAALIVFSIMAIFSAKYRPLAKEAVQCVFLKIRLRPCHSGLDKRVRAAAMMPFVKKSPRTAKFIYKYFSWFSTAFVLLTVISLGYVAWGGYNYALYGNCNGAGSSGFCIFDPSGPSISDTGECPAGVPSPEALIVPQDLSGFKTIHPDATKTVIFFGCYACPYTREGAQAFFDSIDAHPEIKFVLIDFPIERHEGSLEAATAGNCVYDIAGADEYLSYAKKLFSANLSQGIPNYDNPEFNACIESPHPRVALGQTTGQATGIYGTPTYFFGDKAVVGPLNERSVERLIKGMK